LAVPVDRTGTASVAPVMAPPVPGVQKPPRQVGKRFRDRLVAAPEKKVKKPAGLRMSFLPFAIPYVVSGDPPPEQFCIEICKSLPFPAKLALQSSKPLLFCHFTWKSAKTFTFLQRRKDSCYSAQPFWFHTKTSFLPRLKLFHWHTNLPTPRTTSFTQRRQLVRFFPSVLPLLTLFRRHRSFLPLGHLALNNTGSS
jgi:hypothetical protein